MAIRDKMAANAAPYLEPGESIQAVFGGQTVSQWWGLLTGFLMLIFVNYYVVVVVTDRRIMVGRSGRMTTTKITEVLHNLPRQTVIGPASGLWWKGETLGQKLYVHKRFHSDIASADAMLGQAAPPLQASMPAAPPQAPPTAPPQAPPLPPS